MAAPTEDTSTVTTSHSTSDEHGFTQDWVDNHATRAAQRQLEVHNVPHGPPRTQIHQEEEESNFILYLNVKIKC